MIKINRYMVGPLMANCYLIWSDSDHMGVLIDPGGWTKQIEKDIVDNQVQIKKILLTHGHYDHIAGLPQASAFTHAAVCVHKDDADCLTSPGKNISLLMGQSAVFPAADELLHDGDHINISPELSFTVIHTPGHTPGGVCFLANQDMFTGDTLFFGSVGRTDFQGGSYPDIIKSVKRLMAYPDETVVYPGHGEKTSIKFERMNNPYAQ